MTVHVWAPPETEQMPPDSRLCVEPDRGEAVVYHPRSRQLPDGWACPDCGESTPADEAPR